MSLCFVDGYLWPILALYLRFLLFIFPWWRLVTVVTLWHWNCLSEPWNHPVWQEGLCWHCLVHSLNVSVISPQTSLPSALSSVLFLISYQSPGVPPSPVLSSPLSVWRNLNWIFCMETYWATDQTVCCVPVLLRNTMKIRNCLQTTDLAPGLLTNFLLRENSEHYPAPVPCQSVY